MRGARAAPLIAFASLALTACATAGPDFRRPQAKTPAAWSPKPSPTTTSRAVQEPVRSSDWWAAFDDPVLTSLIRRASEANLDLRQAMLRIAEARAERAAVAGAGRPSLNAVASWQGQRVSENTPTGKLFGALEALPGLAGLPAAAPANPYGQFQLGFDASWELDLFGRVRRAVEAADADGEATLEDRRDIQVTVLGEVGRIYIDLRGAQLKRATATQNLAAAREIMRVAGDRRRLGLSTQVDVARAAAQSSLIESQLPLIDRQIATDINALSRLLGLEPGALRAELETVGSVPAPPAEVAIGLPAELICRRPDIRAAEARWHAAVARQGVASAERYPRLTLLATGGYQAQDLTNLVDWASRFGVIGPQAQLPLLDGGRRRARMQAAAYRAQAAGVAYGRTVLGALHEVDGALTAFAEEQTRRAALARAVDQNRAAFQLTRWRYENGLDSILEVLDAERTLHDSELLLVESTSAVSIHLVALHKALGGGWDEGATTVAACQR
ncbi:heavy metal efflux system, outer membrane protein (plasmid) [Phenylobacterium zucineum HLK1]|uniref:Heavy metal efflux system, outer membrane protein n=1 Tax=Phenylobacterium zucineum (strain HLK1) TaxID=450851 RepID=B4RIC0_PHEZH|nr:heavy metal efflux system, outer membrane protein [Phenylobacterium zucineum HLK1]